MTRIILAHCNPNEGDIIELPPTKAHHLTSVLRHKEGDSIIVLNGEGRAYRTQIVRITKKKASLVVQDEFAVHTESPADIVLCQGLLKGEKMDFVIQKATELGVKEIHPLVTTRSIVQETRRLMRWQRIAEAAVEQCGRTVVPIILEPVKFNSFFERFKAGAKPIGIIFWEEGGMSLKEAIQKITSRNLSARRESGAEKGFSEPGIQDNIYVFIGPEGGLTAQEVDTASQRGMIVTTLGPRILRVETAAIAAVSLMQFLLGDMG